MTDLDFDELDKAVNSLMGGVSTPPEKKDDQKTLTIKSTLAENEVPSYDKIDTAARKIGSETLTLPDPEDEEAVALTLTGASGDVTAASIDQAASRITTDANSASAKPKGRFMDVVHPSSDMKTTAMTTQGREAGEASQPASVGRVEAPSLVVAERQPVRPEVATPKAPVLDPTFVQSPSPAASAPEQVAATIEEDLNEAPEPQVQATPTVVTDNQPSAPEQSSEPRSIEDEAPLPEVALEYDISKQTVGNVVDDATTTIEPDTSEGEGAPEELDAATLAQLQAEMGTHATAPVTSASSDDSALRSVSTPLETPFVPDVKVHKRPLGAPASGARSGALLMEVGGENGEARPSDSRAIPDVMLSATETEVMHSELAALEAQHIDVPDDDDRSSDTPVAATTASVPASESSAPQLSTQEQAADAENSLFDTTEYHAPIAHPEKKTSGWVWVLATIVLVLLGAGVAAFLYLSQ